MMRSTPTPAASENTASGFEALYSNTTGSYNTATDLRRSTPTPPAAITPPADVEALFNNTTGY